MHLHKYVHLQCIYTVNAQITVHLHCKCTKKLILTQKCHKVLEFWRKHTEGYQVSSEK